MQENKIVQGNRDQQRVLRQDNVGLQVKWGGEIMPCFLIVLGICRAKELTRESAIHSLKRWRSAASPQRPLSLKERKTTRSFRPHWVCFATSRNGSLTTAYMVSPASSLCYFCTIGLQCRSPRIPLNSSPRMITIADVKSESAKHFQKTSPQSADGYWDMHVEIMIKIINNLTP